jgi:hypothetical protein
VVGSFEYGVKSLGSIICWDLEYVGFEVLTAVVKKIYMF